MTTLTNEEKMLLLLFKLLDEVTPEGAVRAINSHDEMLAALEWFIRWYEAVPAKANIPGPINRGIELARAAIAKATAS